jgi:hypothetical protein
MPHNFYGVWRETCEHLGASTDATVRRHMERLYNEFEISVMGVKEEQEMANEKLLAAQKERDGLLALLGSRGADAAQVGVPSAATHTQLVAQAQLRLRSDCLSLQRTLESYQDNTIIYYEVTVEHLDDITVGIGFSLGFTSSPAPAPASTPPPLRLGLFPGSLALTAHTGCVARGGQERPFASAHRLQQGDVFGCGWDVATGEIFFTRNGELLGIAFHAVPKNQHYMACSFFPYNSQGLGQPIASDRTSATTAQAPAAGVRVAGSLEVSFNFGGPAGRRFRYRDLPLGGLLLPQGGHTMSYDPRCAAFRHIHIHTHTHTHTHNTHTQHTHTFTCIDTHLYTCAHTHIHTHTHTHTHTQAHTHAHIDLCK